MSIELDAIQTRYPRPESRSETIRQIQVFCDENNLTIHPNGKIKPGDLYVGIRNTGPHLLKCKSISSCGTWINSVEIHYSYDVIECVKVTAKE